MPEKRKPGTEGGGESPAVPSRTPGGSPLHLLRHPGTVIPRQTTRPLLRDAPAVSPAARLFSRMEFQYRGKWGNISPPSFLCKGDLFLFRFLPMGNGYGAAFPRWGGAVYYHPPRYSAYFSNGAFPARFSCCSPGKRESARILRASVFKENDGKKEVWI